MSQSLTLSIYKGDQFLDRKTLVRDVIKIGKLKTSDLCLEDDAVARMHAVIEVSGSDVRVIDLGSATGTLLNDRRVDKHAVIGTGDTLAFGPYRVALELAQDAATAVARGMAFAPPDFSPTFIGEVTTETRARRRPEAAEVELRDGSTVTEVVATYGSTILDVRHVDQTPSKRGTAPALLALGGLMLVAGLGVFASEVAQDWDGYQAEVTAAAEAGRPAPHQPGTGLGGLALGLAFAGLVPFGLGVVRRGDTGLSSYTIGEGHHATFHTPTVGSGEEIFPLVQGGNRGASELNFTPSMRGEVILDGQRLTFAQLVASGRAFARGSTYGFALPPRARCRVEHGDVTFHVRVVPRGRVQARRGAIDRPFWVYNAAALAGVGTLLVLTHLIPDAPMDLKLDELSAENRFVGYMSQPDEALEHASVDEIADGTQDAGGAGQRHAGDEGKMGKPTATKNTGLYAIKGPKDAMKQMARDFDPDMTARNAGILGMIQQESGHFLASPYGDAFAVGNDDTDVWGGLTGNEVGEAFGTGGLGLVGTGRGGGGGGEGTIGLGRVGRIGKGGCSGGTCQGDTYGRGGGTGFQGRGKRAPQVRITKAAISSAVDKDIIRRVVRNHINEVRHCYNQGLVRDPNLRGRVAVQFTIGPTGKVPAAVVQESTLADRNVADCVAKAVRRWSFPKPQGGGTVMVTYPFVLSPG